MQYRWSSVSSTKPIATSMPGAARLRARQARVVGAHGDLGDEVAEEVAGQRQLREGDEVRALGRGRAQPLGGQLEVGVHVPQRAGASWASAIAVPPRREA